MHTAFLVSLIAFAVVATTVAIVLVGVAIQGFMEGMAPSRPEPPVYTPLRRRLPPMPSDIWQPRDRYLRGTGTAGSYDRLMESRITPHELEFQRAQEHRFASADSLYQVNRSEFERDMKADADRYDARMDERYKTSLKRPIEHIIGNHVPPEYRWLDIGSKNGYTLIREGARNYLDRVSSSNFLYREPFAYLHMQCPSTGQYYALRVPPHLTNVDEALAYINHGVTEFEVEV